MGIRLAFCTAGELFGGVEQYLLALHTGLTRNGIEPVLILFHDRELASRAREVGLQTVIISSRHRYDLAAARNLADVLARARVDVVHVHGYKAMVVCALARRRHRFAVVKTEHGRPEPVHGRPIAWVKSQVYSWLDTWATRTSGATVCYVTNDLYQHYASSHRGLPRETVYNGIEPLNGESTERPVEYETGLFQLAIVGRVDTVKGIQYALRAMADPSMPDSVRLNIIGSGPLLESLKTTATTLGVLHRARFLGFRRNIYDYIAHCDALLIPSLHEGLPYTLLEAMSLGKPIIASRVGGLAEILRHGQTALLFEPANVDGMLKAIFSIVRDPKLATKLGCAAREEQHARFTLAAMCDSYLRVYGAALEASQRR